MLLFAPTAAAPTHRYWRLMITSGASTAYAFAEIQLRTVPGVPLGFTGGNATAADTFGGVPGPYDANKAADGNINTLWSSNNNVQPQWWAYDLGAGNARNVAEVAITARNDGNFVQAPNAFTPQWSDDNTAWTSLTPITTAPWSSAGQTQAFAVH